MLYTQKTVQKKTLKIIKGVLNMAKKEITITTEELARINEAIERNNAGRTPLDHRIDCVFYVIVKNANPNGDPLADNEPRTDDFGGFITNVCTKNWIRRFLEAFGYKMFISKERIDKGNYSCLETELKDNELIKPLIYKCKSKDKDGLYDVNLFKRYMCSEFFDVRAFGSIFPYFNENVSIAGPVTICRATSIDPVYPVATQITKSVAGVESEKAGTDTLGSQKVVPFGVYKFFLSIGGIELEKTGFSREDAEALKNAIVKMFEVNKSNAKPYGSMIVSDLFWFEHDSLFPNINSATVFESVDMKLKDGVDTPGCYEDYLLTISDIGVKPEHYNFRTGWVEE